MFQMKKVRFSCKGKPMQHLPLVENRSEPITEAFSQVSQVFSKRIGCKMQPKATHKCAYANDDGKVTLESLADAVCFLSSMLAFYMFHLIYEENNSLEPKLYLFFNFKSAFLFSIS